MSKGIELSPKHGLNPTVLVCFFCGEDKNELALLGRVRSKKNSDVEAPRRAVLNTEPCDKCKAHMAQGVILISVRDNEADTDGNPYRSGGWVVLKAEDVARLVQHHREQIDLPCARPEREARVQEDVASPGA